jgi:hypothetical protein
VNNRKAFLGFFPAPGYRDCRGSSIKESDYQLTWELFFEVDSGALL